MSANDRNIINHLQNTIEKQNKRIDELIEYIRAYGYCGINNDTWEARQNKCFECTDKDVCDRYRLLIKWG
jgi:hypothetical protein